MMHESGQSDSPVVPGKSPNKAGQPAAEGMEGRGLATGNSRQRTALRTQSRDGASSALARVREVAVRDRKVRFTALLHHVYDSARLEAAYFALKRTAAPGVDGETWQHYGEHLAGNLADLADRLKRGAYRAEPVRRVYIAKADGGRRPLGVPALEDKIVQRATVDVLNAIYESDFLGFSYGFRPGRGPHHALDALYVGLFRRRVNWVLDADIRGFFDALDHGWLVTFIEHRIADRRVVRLIQKWLNAGVLEDGTRTWSETGTPQGGSASPLLANVYLHYVFDLWVHRWRRTHARGDVLVVRYADDFIMGFQYRDDAERFLVALRERFAKFALELHPDKTRLLEFGTYAAEHRKQRGLGKPDTFTFLGFTHICGTQRSGRFTVLRQTMRKRMQTKLREVKSRTPVSSARPGPGHRRVAALGHSRAPAVLRSPDELASALHVLRPGRASLAPGARPAQSARLRHLGADAAASAPLVACSAHRASLPDPTLRPSDLRQEPSAGKPLAGIRGGGARQLASLLRHPADGRAFGH
jgi:RNA-directed DNA polymerase